MNWSAIVACYFILSLPVSHNFELNHTIQSFHLILLSMVDLDSFYFSQFANHGSKLIKHLNYTRMMFSVLIEGKHYYSIHKIITKKISYPPVPLVKYRKPIQKHESTRYFFLYVSIGNTGSYSCWSISSISFLHDF